MMDCGRKGRDVQQFGENLEICRNSRKWRRCHDKLVALKNRGAKLLLLLQLITPSFLIEEGFSHKDLPSRCTRDNSS